MFAIGTTTIGWWEEISLACPRRFDIQAIIIERVDLFGPEKLLIGVVRTTRIEVQITKEIVN